MLFCFYRGFKGKSPQTKTEASKPVQQQKSPQQQQQQQTASGLKNTFHNDGSFLEQFRRMSEAKNQAAASSVSKVAPVKLEPIPSGKLKIRNCTLEVKVNLSDVL